MNKTFRTNPARTRVLGICVQQVVYPDKQLYGGYVERQDQINDSAMVTQNACVLDRAGVYESAYIHTNAIIRGNVSIRGNAFVGGSVILDGQYVIGGNARIESERDFLVVGPIGSRKAYTVFHKMLSPGMLGVSCGCFAGTIKEFTERVHRTYPAGSVFRSQYDAAIAMAKATIKFPGL